MAKTKEQKQNTLDSLKDKLSEQKAAVFVDFSKVDSKTLFKLRAELKKEDCNITVIKKTILKKALNASGKKDLVKHIDEIKGQLALVYGFGDEVAPSRICFEASKENENVKILGGILANEYQEQGAVLALAQLPSKQQLLGQLVGSLNSPISGFVHSLKGNLSNLVCVLNEIQKVK
jgi:large subunit ribosomal protein L10